MQHKHKKNVLVEGPIEASFIAESIQKHNTKKEIGAHSIFLGQVRQDQHGEQRVNSILYSAYDEMATDGMHKIREEIFLKYPITCLHIYHSLGEVKAGEISLFVFVSSPHRREAMDACNEIVERIKTEVPIWGKEVLEDGEGIWKINE